MPLGPSSHFQAHELFLIGMRESKGEKGEGNLCLISKHRLLVFLYCLRGDIGDVWVLMLKLGIS